MWNKAFAFNPFTRWQRIDVAGVGHEAKPMAQAAQSILNASLLDAGQAPQTGAGRAVLG